MENFKNILKSKEYECLWKIKRGNRKKYLKYGRPNKEINRSDENIT